MDTPSVAARTSPNHPSDDGVPPSAVVFDLGGVLIDWDPRHLYRKLFPGDEAAMEAFLATVCTPEWNARQDAGRPWAEAVATLVEEFPAERELIVAYHERWQEMLGGAIEGTVAILAELRARGVPAFALSNWSAETFPVARERYPFLAWFDGLVISGEERLAKPDPRLFRVLLERHRLDPQSTVYVDDSAANVDVATGLGMAALLFRGPDDLRADLARLGLLEEPPTSPPDRGPGARAGAVRSFR
jgi:2-haloacid dehalogenase